MKSILLIIILLLGLISEGKAQKLFQLFETESVDCRKDSDSYTYENDTIRIDYVFWADNGVMSFRVLNKTNKPLYINWFKSSYIGNALRYQYWTDNARQEINYEAIAKANSVQFPAVSGYTGVTELSKSKPEKVSSIPPRSCVQKIEIYLMDKAFTDWGTTFAKSNVPRHDNPKVTTTIYRKGFAKSDSPLDFRNFLTLSFKDDFSSEFYIDNEFYVKSVSVMERDHFWDDVPNTENQHQDYRDFPNRNYHITRFKRATDFYLKVH